MEGSSSRGSSRERISPWDPAEALLSWEEDLPVPLHPANRNSARQTANAFFIFSHPFQFPAFFLILMEIARKGNSLQDGKQKTQIPLG